MVSPTDDDGRRLKQQRGRLAIVGTPIGNLSDMTERAAETLRQADTVICEDSRRTGKLLATIGTGDSGRRADLLVANEHTEVPRVGEILQRLAAGQKLALVTDAGMPTISDPGSAIVRAVADGGYVIEVVPGPTAISAAVALSGLDARRFVFEGFLPRKGADRKQRLAEVGAERRTIVLYEAPHRVRRTLDDLIVACGPERSAAICRELTKLHEQVLRDRLDGLKGHFENHEPRGEFVIIVSGRPEALHPPTDDELMAAIVEHLDQGVSRRDAVAAVVVATGAPKRQVYDLANAVERSEGDRS